MRTWHVRRHFLGPEKLLQRLKRNRVTSSTIRIRNRILTPRLKPLRSHSSLLLLPSLMDAAALGRQIPQNGVAGAADALQERAGLGPVFVAGGQNRGGVGTNGDLRSGVLEGQGYFTT